MVPNDKYFWTMKQVNHYYTKHNISDENDYIHYQKTSKI